MRNPTKNNQVFSLVLAFLILFNNLWGAVVEVGTEISKPLGKKKKNKKHSYRNFLLFTEIVSNEK